MNENQLHTYGLDSGQVWTCLGGRVGFLYAGEAPGLGTPSPRTDWQTRLKTLASCNFVGEQQLWLIIYFQQEVVDVNNLGTLSGMSRPSIEDDGILIEYSNGSRCGSGSYKTRIILKCVQGALVSIISMLHCEITALYKTISRGLTFFFCDFSQRHPLTSILLTTVNMCLSGPPRLPARSTLNR